MRRNLYRCEVTLKTPRPLNKARRQFRSGRRRVPSDLGPRACDLFDGVLWETMAVTSSAMEAMTPEGCENELVAILRRALMELAIALHEIQRQLTSIAPDEDKTPSPVPATTHG